MLPQRKIFLLSLLYLVFSLRCLAQYNPIQITANGEKYYVYPFKIDTWVKDITPCGFTLPDGKYLAYATYHFTFKKRKRQLIAKDTSDISALFELKNNIPVGKAYFYDKHLKSNSSKNSFNKWWYSGSFLNGLKEGEWLENSGKIHSSEHYKNGVKNGEFKSTEKTINGKNGYYINGEEVGYFDVYINRNKLNYRNYYDTLKLRDSTFTYYEDGKLHASYDDIKYPIHRKEGSIYKQILSTYIKSIESTELNYSFCKAYDYKGKLTTYMHLKNDSSYYFDSLLYQGNKMSIKKISCPSIYSSDTTCYEVTTKYSYWLSNNTEEKVIEYYHNNKCYKTLFIGHPNEGTVLDSVTTLFSLNDTTGSLWKPMIISTSKGKTTNSTDYYLPALGYDYRVDKLSKSRIQIPIKIDSAQKSILFVDTTNDAKTNIGIVSRINLTKLSPATEDKKILRPHFYNPDETSKISIEVESDFNSENSSDVETIWIYADSADRKFEPEIILKDKTPFTGSAFLNSNKKNRYDKKNNLLTLASFNYYYKSKGNYKNGLKDGTWQYISENSRVNFKKDFSKYFNTHKKIDTYLTVDYLNGLKNGTLHLYSTFTEEGWSYPDIYKKGETIKYLDATQHFINDTLNGPAVYNYPTGKPNLIANYKKGLLHGQIVEFNIYQDTTYKATFKDGKLDGIIVSYEGFLKPSLSVKATFFNNELNGLLEMYGASKWLEIKADTSILRYKKLFYENGKVKEEIILYPNNKYILSFHLINSFNFFEYAPLTETEGTMYGGNNNIRQEIELDSVNNKQFNGTYKNYYNTGQIYCEGEIKEMKPEGLWKFYDIGGTLISSIVFKDSSFIIPGIKEEQKTLGILTGFYNNGKPRCKAFLLSIDVSYDCNTQSDQSAFGLLLIDNYDYYNQDNCINGTGKIKQYNENGQLKATGEMQNYAKTGLWKYYDPNNKLNESGLYINDMKDGPWYQGDLEGLNYEDAACFDKGNEEAVKEYERNIKKLQITKYIYKNGEMVSADYYYIDLNKK